LTTKQSQQSNPFSTGGGGVNFETNIQASFAALMLTGGSAPALPNWPIQSIKLQGRYDDYETDDCIVLAQNPQLPQQVSKLLGQIKHVAHITKQDPTFKDVIHAAWRDFCNPSLFNPDTDHIALITGPLSATDIENVRPILEWSRHCHSAAEFFKKINTARFSSDKKRDKLAIIKYHLDQANNNIPLDDDTFWQFLKSFHLLGYDFDTNTGSILPLIQSMLGLGLSDQSNAHDVWNELLNVNQYANQSAGTISLATLPTILVEKFKPLRQGISTDIDKLKDHSERILASIKNQIGITHIERSNLFDQLIPLVETTNFILINGARGSGKSALAKEFSEKIEQEYQVFCLRSEDLDESHLDKVFVSIGLKSTLKELTAHFAMVPKKVLILESVEKILELNQRGAFTDLLHFLKQSCGWTVIATGRDYAYPQITFNFLQPENIYWAALSVELLTDYELETICGDNPSLVPLTENTALNNLLHIPFWAQLAVRATQGGAVFDAQSTEASFRNAVWQHIIAKEDERSKGMPQLRRQTFIAVAVKRAKAMSYGISEQGFEPEALAKLESDNVLIRDTVKMLISPAHDVLEDWALEAFIDVAYKENENNFSGFISQVGNEPAIRRAFRLWLHRSLYEGEAFEELEPLIVKALSDKSIPKYWQDEMITALLKGADPYHFLSHIQDDLFADNAELLKRFCFILRISCKTPNLQLMKLIQDARTKSGKTSVSLYLSPHGQGWQSIILCLYENRTKITDKQVAQYISVLDEWGTQVSLYQELPEPAREAGLLALYLLDLVEDSYRNEDNTKKLLNVLIKVVSVIKDEFCLQIEKDIFNTQTAQHRNHRSYVRQLLPMALVNMETGFLCMHVPDLLIKLAWHTWFTKKERNNLNAFSHIEVEEYFGLYHFREGCDFFPASGLKGPFFYLLRDRPRKGLDFIIRLCNKAAEKYAPSRLDTIEESLIPLGFTPGVSTVKMVLNDGTEVEQFCSHRLWAGYRGISVLPYLLQSALMALENWLITLVESSENGKDIEGVIDYILRQSNSVMTTSVIASVATGFPEKMGKAIIPVLKAPGLYSWDMERSIQERGGNEANWFASSFHEPMRDIYADERRKAALRPWRRKHLESLITQLQFTDLREEIFEIIDEFRNNLLSSKIDDEEKTLWRFRLHRIDIREWKGEEDKENNRIVFTTQELEPDLQEVQDKTQADNGINNRFISLFLWSDSALNGTPIEHDYFPNWTDALDEAKILCDLLKNSDVSNLAIRRSSGIINSAAVFLRDYAPELKNEDINWCIRIVLEAAILNADNNNEMARADITGYDGSLAAAQVLPIIFDLIEGEKDVEQLKLIISTTLTHTNVITCKAAADGIRKHLWQRDAEFAQGCLNGAIEYSYLRQKELEQRYLVDSQISPTSSEHPQQSEQKLSVNWLTELREQITKCVTNSNEVTLNSHSTWYLLPPILMIPDGSNKDEHIALFVQIIELTVEAENQKKDRNINHDAYEKIPHEFLMDFSKRLAEYLFSIPEQDARTIFDIIFFQIEDAVDLASSLLLNLTFIAEQQKSFEQYWLFWGWFADTLLPYAMEPKALYKHHSFYSHDSDIIRRLLFANIPWQGVDIETQMFSLGVEPITNFIKKSGGNPIVYAAIVKLIYYFPDLFKPAELLSDLADFQINHSHNDLLSEGDTTFYLERILHRLIVQNRNLKPLSKNLRGACLVLLDAMVETSSSQGYFLRESLLQLKV